MPNMLGRRALRSGRRAPGFIIGITLPGDSHTVRVGAASWTAAGDPPIRVTAPVGVSSGAKESTHDELSNACALCTVRSPHHLYRPSRHDVVGTEPAEGRRGLSVDRDGVQTRRR